MKNGTHLEQHHTAWLLGHPDRSQAWLVDRLRDGFDIHHVDGNHSNNDPDNLVLIDAHDHFRLHGAPSLKRSVLAAKYRRENATIFKSAYDAYAAAKPGHITWANVAVLIGWNKPWQRLLSYVRDYAVETGMKWPIHARSDILRGMSQARRQLSQ